MTPSLRAENERLAAKINAVWGARVAWVEDYFYRSGPHTLSIPVVKSKLVNGRLPGRGTYPPFFAGPAPRVRR